MKPKTPQRVRDCFFREDWDAACIFYDCSRECRDIGADLIVPLGVQTHGFSRSLQEAEGRLDRHLKAAVWTSRRGLFPLGELETFADRLQALAHKAVILYCRSGGRSARAGAWARSALGLPKVVNLLGGVSTYEGATLAGFPRPKAFELAGSLEELLRRALDMEKGTYRLYRLLVDEFSGSRVSESIGILAKAEVVHGRAIHRMLADLVPETVTEFDSLFESLPGFLIESGVDSAAAKASLTNLAPQERLHADSVLRALGTMAA